MECSFEKNGCPTLILLIWKGAAYFCMIRLSFCYVKEQSILPEKTLSINILFARKTDIKLLIAYWLFKLCMSYGKESLTFKTPKSSVLLGCPEKFGGKTPTLDTNQKESCLQIDNISVMYGWYTGHVKNDKLATEKSESCTISSLVYRITIPVIHVLSMSDRKFQ